MTLLEAIWEGGQGLGCLMIRRAGEKPVRHEFYQTVAQAEERARTASKDSDVWFAPSIFSQNERTRDCVVSTKALWLDIDVGPEKDYLTETDSATALNYFLQKTGMPEPTIVRSGNGGHVYWILDKALTPDEWKVQAERLKNACKKHGLKADHVCTSDSARVLRVPGTFNYKDVQNPKPVELATAVMVWPTDGVIDKLAVFKTFTSETAKKLNARFAIPDATRPQLPHDANKIADECPQMKLMRETKGNIPEPQWYAGLGVLALCESGEETAHEWSKGYAKYSEAETKEKFERAKEFAPTTCERFGSVAEAICAGCSHKGSIASPIQLGEFVVPKDPFRAVPKFYEVANNGVWFTPPQDKNSQDPPTKKIIIRCPLYISQVMINSTTGGCEVEVEWTTPMGLVRIASFKRELIARPTDLHAWFMDHNVSIGNRALDQVVSYVNAGVDLYNATHNEEIVYDRFGWHEPDFIIGVDRVHESGIERARISQSVDKRRLIHLRTKGDVAAWADATSLLDRPSFWPHRFTVCTALASPLLRLSESEGSVLSLSGESGTGKTTSASFGMSAYGKPKGMTINPQSTENAFYELWRMMSNLPVLCNEAVTMDERKLSNIVYAAANGEARDRLQRDGKMREADDFATVTVLTNNKHVLSLPDKILNDATRRRILEITFTKEHAMELAVGTRLNKVMRTNYGHVGRVFMQYVLQNRDTVEGKIHDLTSKLEKGIHSANRYNLWLVSATTIAFEIASQLGLIKFQYADALQEVLAIIRRQDTSIVSTVQKVEEAVTRYIQTFQGYITVKSTGKHGGWKEYVKGEVRARYTIEKDGSHTLCLPYAQFSEWAIEKGIDNSHIKQFVTEKKYETKPERIASLTDPVKCLIIPGFKDGEE